MQTRRQVKCIRRSCLCALTPPVSPPKERICTQSCVATQRSAYVRIILAPPPPTEELRVTASTSCVASNGVAYGRFVFRCRLPRSAYVHGRASPTKVGICTLYPSRRLQQECICARHLPAPLLKECICTQVCVANPTVGICTQHVCAASNGVHPTGVHMCALPSCVASKDLQMSA